MRIAAALILLVCGSCTIADSDPVEAYATTPDGIKLYYRSVGDGPETVIAPFALFHGSALDALADGRRVVTYDPRGRGRSDPAPLDTVSLDHLLADFDTVRAAVGAEKVAIIGFSGAGMEMFVYTLRNPDRVEALVQLAPVAARFEPYGMQMMEDRQRRTDAAAQADYRRRVGAGEFEDDPAAQCRAEAAVTMPPIFADTTKAALVPDVCDSPNEHPETVGAYFGKLFESIVGYDWRDELATVPTRRLVVHGAKDNIPLEGNREWVAGQPNARLLVIENAGHMPHYEQPDETISAIDAFLDGSWPEGAVAVPD